jgi:hypothetical protein
MGNLTNTVASRQNTSRRQPDRRRVTLRQFILAVTAAAASAWVYQRTHGDLLLSGSAGPLVYTWLAQRISN